MEKTQNTAENTARAERIARVALQAYFDTDSNGFKVVPPSVVARMMEWLKANNEAICGK